MIKEQDLIIDISSNAFIPDKIIKRVTHEPSGKSHVFIGSPVECDKDIKRFLDDLNKELTQLHEAQAAKVNPFPPCIKIEAKFYDANAKCYYIYNMGIVEVSKSVLDKRLNDLQEFIRDIWPFVSLGIPIEEFMKWRDNEYHIVIDTVMRSGESTRSSEEETL